MSCCRWARRLRLRDVRPKASFARRAACSPRIIHGERGHWLPARSPTATVVSELTARHLSTSPTRSAQLLKPRWPGFVRHSEFGRVVQFGRDLQDVGCRLSCRVIRVQAMEDGLAVVGGALTKDAAAAPTPSNGASPAQAGDGTPRTPRTYLPANDVIHTADSL